MDIERAIGKILKRETFFAAKLANFRRHFIYCISLAKSNIIDTSVDFIVYHTLQSAAKIADVYIVPYMRAITEHLYRLAPKYIRHGRSNKSLPTVWPLSRPV